MNKRQRKKKILTVWTKKKDIAGRIVLFAIAKLEYLMNTLIVMDFAVCHAVMNTMESRGD